MKKVCLAIVLLSSLLVGCNQQLDIDDYIDEVKENSAKTVAEQYVSNLLVQEKLLTSNSRAVSTTELTLFEEIEIDDYAGTPYGLSISKDLTNKIYCSQLCYLAWKDVADKYKINSGLLIVTPSELISSRDTTLEGSIDNDYFPSEASE